MHMTCIYAKRGVDEPRLVMCDSNSDLCSSLYVLENTWKPLVSGRVQLCRILYEVKGNSVPRGSMANLKKIQHDFFSRAHRYFWTGHLACGHVGWNVPSYMIECDNLI